MNLADTDSLRMFEDEIEAEIEENDRVIVDAMERAHNEYLRQIYEDEHYNSPECNQ